MKNEIANMVQMELEAAQSKKISRKEAIRKTGLVALSAATMMMLVGSSNTAHAASPSPPPNPPGGWGPPGIG